MSCVLVVGVGNANRSDTTTGGAKYTLRHMDNRHRILNNTVVSGKVAERGGWQQYWFTA